MHDVRRNSKGETLPPRTVEDLTYDDRLAGFPAQPDNLAVDRAVSLLRAAANVLLAQAAVLQTKPTRGTRAVLKRVLSGVLADVETVRQSIRE